jgi:hypothetical protein
MNHECLDKLPLYPVTKMTQKGIIAGDAILNLLHYFAIVEAADPCIFIFEGTTSHVHCSIVEAA